jgi:anhydro-N-acetylmuramic acid kinase
MKIIGLISGTSGDGVDAVLCEISGAPPNFQTSILHATTRSYEPGFRQRILDACLPGQSRVDLLCQLNVDIGELFAETTLQLINQAGLTPGDIDLIGSHGQTVWHNVLPDGRVSATLQIAESAVLAERTGITTISNLRARDVAAGGQGAPLTAYVDWLLFRRKDHWRAVQNIGGIGNVTFLPPTSDDVNAPTSLDTGPGNVLMDAAVKHITDGTQTFDQDGTMARRGQIDEGWLNVLLQHPYYAQPLPKTTGRELFGTEMALQLVAEGQRRGLSANDIITTLTALTAHSIADAYQRFAPQPIHEVILGGGGSRNPVLVAMLQRLLNPAPVRTHEDIGLNSDFKEGLVFALLAYETWHFRPGNHPAMTGATHPVVLGQITPGANYIDLIKRTWCGK